MPKKSPSRGLTLIEVVVSSAAAVILIGGMASAVLLTTRGLPSSAGELLATQAAVELADQIAAELRCATGIHDATAHTLDFDVPDRNSDGVVERITYSWAGTGQPVMRSYNGSAGVAVLAPCDEFALEFSLATSSYKDPDVIEVSGETLLSSYESSSDLSDYRVRSNAWPGEVFRPTLPENAIEWTPQRLVLRIAQDGVGLGSVLIQLRAAEGAVKVPTVIQTQLSVAESSLPTTLQWVSFTLPACSPLPADEYAAISLQHVADTVSCRVRYQTKKPVGTTTAMFQSTDSGGTWNLMADCNLLYYLYGRVTTLTEGATHTLVHVTEARLKVQTPALDEAVETAVTLLNAPEVLD